MSLEASFRSLVRAVPDALKSFLAVVIPCLLKVKELLPLGICVKTDFGYGIDRSTKTTMLVD